MISDGPPAGLSRWVEGVDRSGGGMEERIRFRGGCAPLVRSDGSIQFGTDPRSGIRLAGLSETERDWLVALAAAGPRTGTAPRLPDGRAEQILTLLDRFGVLERTDPGRAGWQFAGENWGHEVTVAGVESVHRRAGACVWVRGRGALPATLADVLRRAGVGEVDRDGLRHSSLRYRRHPDLVVLASGTHLGEAEGIAWQRHGIPQLPVHIGAHEVTVGPLVRPGNGPCLRCLDLVRADLDPSWRWLQAQLPARVAGLAAGESALSTVGAGLAARVVLAHLDGEASPPGVALEVSGRWPELAQRQWPTHPDCGCCIPPVDGPVTMRA